MFKRRILMLVRARLYFSLYRKTMKSSLTSTYCAIRISSYDSVPWQQTQQFGSLSPDVRKKLTLRAAVDQESNQIHFLFPTETATRWSKFIHWGHISRGNRHGPSAAFQSPQKIFVFLKYSISTQTFFWISGIWALRFVAIRKKNYHNKAQRRILQNK